MAGKHIVELLVEANKKIVQITDQIENEKSSDHDRQTWISDLNTVIRQLDHIVEDLEKSS